MKFIYFLNKKFSNNNFKAITTYVVILGLISSPLLTGCSSTSTTEATATTQAEVVDGESKMNKNALLVYGEAKVDEIEELQIDFPARITNILVQKGVLIHKGDALLDLNMDDYMLQIATLEKELEGYELELKGLKNNTNAQAANLDALSKELALKKGYVSSGQDPDILPLKNSLDILKEDLAEAQKLYDSNLILFESGAVSESELSQSKLSMQKLEQQIQDVNTSIQKLTDGRNLEISTLQSKLNATTLEVGNIDTSTASKISQLQVKIESAHLSLQNMKAKLTAPYLNGTQIIAPKDQLIIYDISTPAGSSVSGLGQSLLKFMDLNTLYVSVEIPEESLSEVAINAPVTIQIADKDIDTPITGIVSRISNYAYEKEGDTIVEAYIKVTSGKEQLKPGLSIDAYIEPLT
ncbi:MAG: HlyD family efflux transporter periplasmic adaptor subunit [Cellulosilyticum sp.]|nr:HlyD family efflux transporter periplasmic adaptor subunit [Cellulosilyticum sp.]